MRNNIFGYIYSVGKFTLISFDNCIDISSRVSSPKIPVVVKIVFKI